jgi:hypothetical protein
VFDLISQAISAWNQSGLLICGGFLAGLGALLLGNRIYWRLGTRRIPGTVIGVRQTDKSRYYPVYRYVSASGETIEATSDSGSNATSRMGTGLPVRLMVFDRDPHKAADADSYVAEIIGALLIGSAAGLIYLALSIWPVTRVTCIVLAGLAIYAAYRLRASVTAAVNRPSLSQWRQKRRQYIEAVPVRPLEEILSSTESIEQPAEQRTVSPAVRAILVIVGIALLAVGVHLGRSLMRLQAAGEHAPGTVAGLQAESDADSPTYHPVVRFSTPDGPSIEFKDRVGTDPPSYRAGDPVTVLYDPESPRDTAMIDRGLWNWLAPGALCLFGLIVGAAGLSLRRTGGAPQRSQSAFR